MIPKANQQQEKEKGSEMEIYIEDKMTFVL